MYHEGIQQFVRENDLNPHDEGFNFRQIFGTATRSDAIYSTPRVWYGHQRFSPQAAKDETPESQDLPFLIKPERKLSVEDAQDYLASHYQGTPYDPIGRGTEDDKHRYRPISLAKTQEAHVLQMNRASGNNLHWLAMGVAAESTFVPFFADISDTPTFYKRGKLPAQLNSAYWVYKHVGVLVDSHLHDFLPLLEDVQKEWRIKANQFVHDSDQATSLMSDDEKVDYFTTGCEHFSSAVLNAYKHLSMELITKMTDYSPLNFNTDENL